MSDDVGPLRTKDKLKRALDTIDELTTALGDRPFGDGGAFDMQRLDWFDLRNMLTVARAVTQAASLRTESRGAHQREDFPEMLPQWRVNQVIRLRGEQPRHHAGAGLPGGGRRAMSETATLKIWRGQDKAAGPLGNPRRAVRARPVGARRAALDPRQQGPVAGDPLLLHQRQCLQGMHDGTRRRDGLCLHRAARAARDDAWRRCRTRSWCAISSPRSRRPPNDLL